MGKFCEAERKRQYKCKGQGRIFSKAACKAGVYRGKEREFCLPLECAVENLYGGIREKAQQYFNENKISWHNGKGEMPSNHLCSSQVCCVNFLFPFSDKPDLLKTLLLPFFSDIKKMLPVEAERFISFEWIGESDYLGEAAVKGRVKRSRGSLFTSADAMIRFEKNDGRKQSVLIEWKYTESYSGQCIAESRSGTDRTKLYQDRFNKPTCKIDKKKAAYEAYFYEPFYQLLRQQLLAQEMEAANESGADIVTVLHIAPAANLDFKKVTSKELASLGASPVEIWQKVVMEERFKSVSTEELFGNMSGSIVSELSDWVEYIKARYAWIGLRS